MVTEGGVVSRVTCTLLVSVLPPGSVATQVTVFFPSRNETSALNVPVTDHESPVVTMGPTVAPTPLQATVACAVRIPETVAGEEAKRLSSGGASILKHRIGRLPTVYWAMNRASTISTL